MSCQQPSESGRPEKSVTFVNIRFTYCLLTSLTVHLFEHPQSDFWSHAERCHTVPSISYVISLDWNHCLSVLPQHGYCKTMNLTLWTSRREIPSGSESLFLQFHHRRD